MTRCSVGPPHPQARRHLSVYHFPAAAFHQAAVAGRRGGVVGAGDEDSGRWGELFRLLCFHLEEEVGKGNVSHGVGSG